MPRFVRGSPAPQTVAEKLACCSAGELKCTLLESGYALKVVGESPRPRRRKKQGT